AYMATTAEVPTAGRELVLRQVAVLALLPRLHLPGPRLRRPQGAARPPGAHPGGIDHPRPGRPPRRRLGELPGPGSSRRPGVRARLGAPRLLGLPSLAQ